MCLSDRQCKVHSGVCAHTTPAPRPVRSLCAAWMIHRSELRGLTGKIVQVPMPPSCCSASYRSVNFNDLSTHRCWERERGFLFKILRSAFLKNNGAVNTGRGLEESVQLRKPSVGQGTKTQCCKCAPCPAVTVKPAETSAPSTLPHNKSRRACVISYSALDFLFPAHKLIVFH